MKDPLGGKLSEINMLQLDFWTEFNEYLQKSGHQLRSKKPRPQHWYDITVEGIPSSQACCSLTVSFAKNFIRCQFYIYDNKDLYNKIYQRKAEIEAELGYELRWEDNPKVKSSGTYLMKGDVKLKDKQTWEGSFKWLVDNASRFSEVFRKYYS